MHWLSKNPQKVFQNTSHWNYVRNLEEKYQCVKSLQQSQKLTFYAENSFLILSKKVEKCL